jgi:hypothetical protein
MDDDRIWAFEEHLWTGDAARYRECIDDECVMVVPAEPHVLTGGEAAEAMADTPRWSDVQFDARRVSRPQEGLIVIAYEATARRGEGESYRAWCTSTYRRLGHEEWRVVQHQQTPPLTAG